MSHWLLAPRGLGPLSAPRPRPPLRPVPGMSRLLGSAPRPRPAGPGMVLPFSSPRSRVRIFRQRPEQS
jgi:hypothetical protein